MKIKIFILFSVLFFGIGFEGFGQYYSYDGFVKVKLETDTADVAFYKKLKIIRSCENLLVHENARKTINLYNVWVVIPDSLYDGEVGWSPTKDMLLFSSKNDGIVDVVVQPMTKELPVMERNRSSVWGLNRDGKYKICKIFDWGNVVRVARDDNQTLLIEVESSGCCDNYFMCNDIYSYENDSLILQKQICYLKTDRYVKDATELKENRTFITVDSAYLIGNNPRGYGDFVEMVDYTTGKDSIMEYDYDEEIIAVIAPNQKGKVLATRFVDNLYWYLIVFPPQSIQRRIFDGMIGNSRTRLYFAGWITSEKPLKIESK